MVVTRDDAELALSRCAATAARAGCSATRAGLCGLPK
ncbi:MAG: hypothetical protein QOG01_979 [Pseudonocardiales bacterium]|nr:hypothetical protein [Pseudonocardiales bacterium]